MTTEDRLREITIGEPARLDGPVTLAGYDPAWPERFEQEAARIRAALGRRALLVEHAGSTAVPGLLAKPIVDIVLAVADSRAEATYVPALEAAGFVLSIREPEWHEHRMLRTPDKAVNLHVFTARSPEVDRMLRFRDRLRANEEDRERYAAAKRALAGRTWRYVQDYADAKGAVVEEVLAHTPAMSDHVYKSVEVTGSSATGVTEAIDRAVAKASESLRNLDWFEVLDIRGHLADGRVAHYQVTLKIGFRLED